MSIQVNNFRSGSSPEWLGIGAYFFVDGISCEDPSEDAKNWAIFRGENYDRWAVMTAVISTEKILDLTLRPTLKKFNKYRKICRRRFSGKVPDRYIEGLSGIDVFVLAVIRDCEQIHAAKGDFYTQFNKDTRKIPSRLPNATLLCVYKPAEVIDPTSIKEISTGLVP